jgi:hypothetical protein
MKPIKNKQPKHLKDGRSKFNIMKGFKNLKFKFKKQSSLIVADMELKSGDLEMFVVEVKNKTFKLFNKRYLVNEKYLKYNRTIKMWVGKYHEDLSLPINQTIPAGEIVDSLSEVDDVEIQDVVNNIDPSILQSLITTQIIQKVFAGEKMQDIFGFIKIMLILIAVGVAITSFIMISSVV